MNQIKSGDILFFKGTTPVFSRIIRWVTKSPYTHVGIAVTPNWIYEIDIDKRLAIHPIRNDDYDVYRYKEGLTEDQRTSLMLNALQRAKNSKGYDWLKIISFGLEKIFRIKTSFDKANREICSEIVDYLYYDIGIDLLPNRKLGHATPAHLVQSPELIKVFSYTA